MEENYQPRSVSDVLMDILLVIPVSEKLLIDQLHKFNQDLDYKAPELLVAAESWFEFVNILNNFIPNKTEDWQIKIRDILNNKC